MADNTNKNYRYIDNDQFGGKVLEPGSKIQNTDITVLDILGAGSFGVAYLCQNNGQGQVVVKMLRQKFRGDSTHVKLLMHECDIGIGLKSISQVAGAFQFGDHDGMRYIVLPYIKGETLEKKLRNKKMTETEDVVRFFLSFLDAVHLMHSAECIHRDLKPENIIVREEDGAACIIDLGTATHVGEKEGDNVYKTQDGQGGVRGTPVYMSQLQFSHKAASPKMDLFAISVMLFEAITGKMPIEVQEGDAYTDVYRKYFQQKHYESLDQLVKNDAKLSMFFQVLKMGFKSGELGPEEGSYFASAEEFLDALKNICEVNFPTLWAEISRQEAKEKTGMMNIGDIITQIDDNKRTNRPKVVDTADTMPPAEVHLAATAEAIEITLPPGKAGSFAKITVAVVGALMLLAAIALGAIWLLSNDEVTTNPKTINTVQQEDSRDVNEYPAELEQPSSPDAESSDASTLADKAPQQEKDIGVKDTGGEAKVEEDASKQDVVVKTDTSPKKPPKVVPRRRRTRPPKVEDNSNNGAKTDTPPTEKKKPKSFLTKPPSGTEKKPKSFLNGGGK